MNSLLDHKRCGMYCEQVGDHSLAPDAVTCAAAVQACNRGETALAENFKGFQKVICSIGT